MAAISSNVCQRKAHFTFTWTIENGYAIYATDLVLSPRFFVQPIEKTNWRMKVSRSWFIGIFDIGIRREKDDGPDSIEIEFELSVVAADGSPLRVNMYKKQFKCEDEYKFCFIEDNNEIFLQNGAKFLPNDELTVRCRMWRTGTEISKVDSCFARTRLGVDRRSFVWAVKEISSLRPGEERTHSLNPTSNGPPQLILNLFLSESNGKNYISIRIDKNDPCAHFFFCKFSLLDNNGSVVHSDDGLYYCHSISGKVCTFLELFDKDKLMNEESSLLQNDILSLKCDYLIDAEPVFSRIENYRYLNLEDLQSITTETPEMNLGQPYESATACCPFKRAFVDLYENESLSDVSLRAGAKSLPAHKNVLSVRSPVFEAMFKQDMREKTSKIVDIPDFNPDTVGRLLLYIYKDTVDDLQWESALDLYREADKYQLLDLRKKCSLKSNISMISVCSILSLADMHDGSDLRKAAENFYIRTR